MTDRDILPDFFKPNHYDLIITHLNFKNWTYHGKVVIEGQVERCTKEIVLNSLELSLTEASLVSSVGISSATRFSNDEKKQRVAIALESEAPIGPAQLVIQFTGVLNNASAGFYRSQYKPAVPPVESVPKEGDFHYMLSTQFESCDARRAFPCFDEPNLKATFDFAIEIPFDQVALSNMPVREVSAKDPATKLVKFERSPIMSTYLLAWAVGDFEYVEAFTERKYQGKKLPVRVYTTRGLKEQGLWALEHAPKIIDYYSTIFGLDYPLPKADLLAVHEFTHGAMENWGLVTYRTTAVLFDEKTSEARYRNRVAYVVAHELAHQWFGNLVTMDWWDELWLNEGFATWVGWLATDYLHPEWKVWAQFVSEGMDQAFKLDSIRASHPIHVPVRDALDVNQIFDHISYLKGCSTIRMLASHLGVKTFLKGVSNYLKTHAYGNAKTDALWSALSEASGTNINELMDSWIQKVGFPVVSISESSGEITVQQSRFLSTGDTSAEDDTTTWWVPLLLSDQAGATANGRSLALTTKQGILPNVSGDFYHLNTGATGFYRVNYPPEHLARLGAQIDRLSDEDKIFTIGSAYDMAFSGQGTASALLSFVKGMKSETSYLVWSQVLDSIGSIKGIFQDNEEIKTALQNFILELICEAAEKVGWEFRAEESYLAGLLRKRLILTAVVNGHEAITTEALKRFDAYVESAAEVHPNLRTPLYRAANKANPKDSVKFLKEQWYSTPAVDGKEICLSCLGHTQDEDLLKEHIIPFLFNISPPSPASESVPSVDMHTLGGALAVNGLARPLLWEFMRKNWSQVEAKMSNPIVLDRFVKVSLQQFTTEATIAEIDEFFATKDTSAYNRTLETVKDKVRARDRKSVV